MALKLRLQKDRIRIDYREDNDNPDSEILATFFVEPLSSTELNDLFKKHERKEWLSPNRKTKKELHKEINFIEAQKERVCKEIVDWEGILDEKNKPIKCTDENKMAAWDFNPDIINWVLDEIDSIKENKEKTKKEQEKN